MNKKVLFSFAIATLFFSCKSASDLNTTALINEVGVTIDLNKIVDDKVLVTVKSPTITSSEIVYQNTTLITFQTSLVHLDQIDKMIHLK